jgi:N-acetylneuraminic acid mutarotase/TolB-like protein
MTSALALALALALAAPARIAVMPIAPGASIPQDQAASLTETLAAEVRQQSKAQVVTARDLASVLSHEQQKQALGCTSDSCLAEIAGAAGADRLVIGDVARLGESLVVQLRLLDARSAAVLTQSHRRFKRGTFDDLLDALSSMVGELLAAPPPGAATAAAPPPPPPPTPSAAPPSPAPAGAKPAPPATATPSARPAPATRATGTAPATAGWPPRGAWATAPELPEPRTGLALVELGGKLYAFGGWRDGPRGTAQVYDPAARAWRALAPMPTPRTEAVAVVVNGRILLLGGWTGTHSDAVEEYDPATDRWAKRTSMPSRRASMAGAALDGRVYLFGGNEPNRPVGVNSGTLVYDAATDRWSHAHDGPIPRWRAVVGVAGKRLYLIGGETPPSGFVDVFDPAADRWDRKAAKAVMPSPHYWPTAATVGGRFCVLGGADESQPTFGFHVFDSAACYDPAVDRWSALPPLPVPRFGAAAAALDGALWIVGGSSGKEQALAAVHVYRP